MNIVRKARCTIEFDVWEPLQKHVEVEMDQVIKFTKSTLTHAGNVKLSTLVYEDKK